MRSLRAALRLSSRLKKQPSIRYRPALSELQNETARASNGGRSTEFSFLCSRSLSTSTSASSTAESTTSHLEPFSRLTDADVTIFKEILGSKGVITDKEALVPYNTDWTGAFVGRSRLVLRPATTQEASAALAHLNARRLAVVPQGGNTGLVGGGVPIADEVIMSTDRLTEKKENGNASPSKNQVVADATAMTLSAPAGTILADLDARAAAAGLAAPLDLGARGSCRIGGNVATNAGGPRVVRYGSLRSSVLGLEVVAADGTVLDLGRPLRKDATGLDLKQLAIGSEGTLGLITRVTLAAPARPPGPAALALLACPGWEQVLELLAKARATLGESLSAAEFLDAESAALACDRVPGTRHPLPHCRAPYFVLLEAAGARPDHDEQRMDALVEEALGGGGGARGGGGGGSSSSAGAVDGGKAGSGREAEALWARREGVPVALRHAGKCFKYDVSLDVREMPLVVAEARRRVEEAVGNMGGGSNSSNSYSRDRVTVVAYGHLGDGNLHLNVSAPAEAFSGRTVGNGGDGIAALASALEPWVYRATAAARGSVSAEHGLGRMKAEHAPLSKPAEALDLAASIKAVFDPRGILNPGKLLPRGAREAAARRGAVISESDERRSRSGLSSSSSPAWKQWSVAEEFAAAATKA